MPEGHTVHRIARQFGADMVGRTVAASSPQGRFAAGAALVDGATMTAAHAVGKQLFLETTRGEEPRRIIRVHLGLYGAWDFAGRVTPLAPDGAPSSSLGAPRVARALRMGEGEAPVPGAPAGDGVFPPPPVGQVRLRLLTDETVADLRGPTACEVLTPDDVVAVLAKAGPDPALDPEGEDVFVSRLRSRGTPVAVLLMDQSVVSGIGNVYRAELLFRARLDPFTPGRKVPEDVARALWRDWASLLADGIRTGVMLTRADTDDDGRALAIADPEHRHAVYRRTGLPCRVCGTPVALREVNNRNLYWCPTCQR